MIEGVRSYFNEIAKIPRKSQYEQKISNYLVNFAKKNQLKYIQDDKKNVVIYKTATIPTKAAPMILQAHMDMVCEKQDSVAWDPLKQGVRLIEDGEYIRAEGTTLGADNGIAMAYMLAILDSADIEHPDLECVFTSGEETGMTGATFFDMEHLSGRCMLNLDTEIEGIMMTGSAGGLGCKIQIPCERKKVQGIACELRFFGLQGGHSGTDIGKQRINCIDVMTKIYQILSARFTMRLTGFSGGEADNAIPSHGKMEAVLRADEIEQFGQIVRTVLKNYRKELIQSEPDFAYEIKMKPLEYYECMDERTTEKLMQVISFIPHGVLSRKENMVQTSCNLGIVKSEEQEIQIVFSLRSQVNREKSELIEKIAGALKENQIDYEIYTDYSAWEAKEIYRSRLQKVAEGACRKLYHQALKPTVVHAGLECGIFTEKCRDLDVISIGPNILDAHTPMERADIASVERVYQLVLEILKLYSREED